MKVRHNVNLDRTAGVHGAGLVQWAEVPPGASFGLYLREPFQKPDSHGKDIQQELYVI